MAHDIDVRDGRVGRQRGGDIVQPRLRRGQARSVAAAVVVAAVAGEAAAVPRPEAAAVVVAAAVARAC